MNDIHLHDVEVRLPYNEVTVEEISAWGEKLACECDGDRKEVRAIVDVLL